MAAINKLSGRNVVTCALILVLGCLAWTAGKEGISNYYVQLARQEIDRWAASGQRFRGDEWTRVVQYLTESLRYSPNNAWSLEETGSFELRRMRAATDPASAIAAARGANTHFHMALVERPTSPFAWANLALSKLYLDELDDELFAALRHADELGPWEPEVQQSVLFVGLATWHKLDAAQRAAMVRTMARAMRRDAPRVTEIVKSFNRLDLLCATDNNTMKRNKNLELDGACSELQKSG